MKGKNQTVLKAVRMETSLVKELMNLAERENRNFSNMVNHILISKVNDFKEQRS